jgi:GTPase SAR1 family protein
LAAIILVGTQSDLRQDSTSLDQLKERDQSAVSAEEAEAKALEIGAVKYVGCSTNTGHNLKGTFDEAVNAILNCSHAQAQDMSMAQKPKCLCM